MDQVSADVLLIIFSELKDDIASLHSCILVNKFWCRMAMSTLWKYFSCDSSKFNQETRKKLYNTIAHFLPNDPEDPLPKNNINLPLNKFPRAPTFEYMLYFTRISSFLVNDMVNLLINEEDPVYKKNILEEEIYKLIFGKCNNVKQFSFYTTREIYFYPNAKNFFSKLNILTISFKKVENNIILNILFELTKICQCIEELNIGYIREESLFLASFINEQDKLQSLCLNFDNNDDDNDNYDDDGVGVDDDNDNDGGDGDNNIYEEIEEKEYLLLSDVVAKKAAKLKKFMLLSCATSISPIFLTSSVRLQSLNLNNDFGNIGADWVYWESCLDKASFPDLQYLVTTSLPSGIESLIIEKSGGNILKIDIRLPLSMFEDYPDQNNKLIRAIANKCPLLRKLTINIDPTNLIEISRIFSNCTQLEKISFTADVVSIREVVDPNGDELLRIISNISPRTIRKFSFGYKWNFTTEGLESFFKSWKYQKRFPIKFEGYYEPDSTWTNEHVELVAKYNDEGIITIPEKKHV